LAQSIVHGCVLGVVCSVLEVGGASDPVFDELVGDGLLRREEEGGTSSPVKRVDHLEDRKDDRMHIKHGV